MNHCLPNKRVNGIEWRTGEFRIFITLNRILIAMQYSTSDNFEKQALTEHLRELRSCLVIALAAVFVGFCLSYTVIRPLGILFFHPLTEVLPAGTSLIFTSYQEGFFFI